MSPRPARPFKVLTGLVEEFGKDRIIDTPISEAGFTGLGVGAAMAGHAAGRRHHVRRLPDALMDQLVNQAAKIHYMSGGKWKVPMVIRATMGATRRSAAQHSQSLHAWPSHIPGLKVVIPSTPYDAKGLLKAAIRDDNPVVIFEDKISYAKVKGPVPDEDYVIPLGVADVKREGRDITLVATSSMVQVALGAATMLEEIGISAEVVDPRTTWPLDEKTLDRIGSRRRRAASSLTRGTAGTASRRESRPSSRKARSTTSTVPCGGSARCTCRFRSRRRSRMRPCRPNATSSRWRDRCATSRLVVAWLRTLREPWH